MKKDFYNVFLTFLLILTMVIGGNFSYGKKVLAAEHLRARQEESQRIEQANREIQIRKSEEERIAQENAIKQQELKIAAAKDASAREKAAYQAELQARQLELKRQAQVQAQIQAQIEAQKLADQQASVVVRPSRKSRAS